MISIAELVDRASRRFSTRVAVIDGDRRLTFAEVGERSSRLANALLALSPTDGSRVAVLMGNRLEFVEVDFAIAKAGKVKAPINPRLADDERRFILSNCGAEIVITEQLEEERVCALRSDLPDLKHVVVVDREASYGELLTRASAERPPVKIDPDQPSMILHTSGTTGRPMGATTSQRARIAATINMLLDEFSAGERDGMLHMAPMSHGSGSKLLAYFVRGARNITLPKFDPEMFFEAVASGAATSTFVVPTMIRLLLDALDGRSCDLSNLRNITYGGSPMPASLAEEALAVFGPVLTQVYGSCEAPHPVTVLSKSDHVDREHARFRSAGQPALGVQIRIVDDSRQDVSSGAPGELWIRGANLMTGYWGDIEATRKVFSDGWYRSGDIAQLAEDGYVSIVGRERDMLISGGLNVYPAEVETVLHRHPDISEVAVLGVPDDLWGEAVTAVIVTRKGRHASEEDIVRHCKESLADYKKPRRIIFVDTLPKGNTGKVSKQALLEMIQRGHSASMDPGPKGRS
jgi:acyl-CoA synthetase (AMP-forming)/AMP-acid ligase II